MTATLSIYCDALDENKNGWAYLHVDCDGHRDSGPIDDLDDLCDALRLGGRVSVYPEGATQASDMDELPTFGGDVVTTELVWSWDSTRMIVGTCADDYEIVARVCSCCGRRRASDGASLQFDGRPLCSTCHPDGDWSARPSDFECAECDDAHAEVCR